MVGAQAEGLVHHIGVTGHGLRIPSMHMRSLNAFPFASVLFPYNQALLHLDGYRADVEALIELCVERGVAMQTIKSIARRRWSPEVTKRFSWYEPLTEHGAIDRAVRFVLSRPGLFLNSSSDARLLDAIILAATSERAAIAPTPAELDADMREYEMAPLFDGKELERI